jgi:hypothetical protein
MTEEQASAFIYVRKMKIKTGNGKPRAYPQDGGRE